MHTKLRSTYNIQWTSEKTVKLLEENTHKHTQLQCFTFISYIYIKVIKDEYTFITVVHLFKQTKQHSSYEW